MRRHTLRIPVALVTFTVGSLFAGSSINFAFALPAALAVFVLTEVIPDLKIDPHYWQVGIITLILWVAAGYLILTLFLPVNGSCVVQFDPAVDGPITETSQDVQPTNNADSHTNGLTGLTAYSCEGTPYTATTNTIWAGLIDRKAIAKPAPVYPALAKSAAVNGTFAVSVVVDEAGKVMWAQSLSGHPLVRQAVMEAACNARFTPLHVSGPSIRVSGILTYKF